MERSGEIVVKPNFAHSFTVVLALTIHYAPTTVKGSIPNKDEHIVCGGHHENLNIHQHGGR